MPAAGQVKVPSPPGTDLPKAKKMAGQVASNVKKGVKLYDRKLVKAFQTAAGLTPDGLYGPVCASALRYFGAVAPAPLFKGQDLKYVPPGG
jgi:murein L,D-transpeptidase YcbB/YkuD